MASGRAVEESSDAEVDLLVASEHAGLVAGALEDCGVVDATWTPSPALGLTRLVGRAVEPPASSPVAGLTDPAGPLDTVLRRLRTSFEQRYANWAPTLGKNRLVGQVTGGGGTVSHGGGPVPTRAAAPPAREGTAGRGITVGVLDTGVFPHPALAGRYLGTTPDDVVSADDSAPDRARPYAAGHATFVAGLILREAPGAAVRVRKVLDDDGTASSWDVANAIVELGRSGVQILNLSFVCYTADGKPPLALATAVDRLDPDVLVVACAGNHGDPSLGLEEDDRRKPSWPAALDDVVAVGSGQRVPGRVGRTYTMSPFTPRGAAWIDVVTPGEDVVSTYFHGPGPDGGEPFDGWASWSGTSFAAARLAGAVAARADTAGTTVRSALEDLVAARTARARRVSDPDWDWPPPFLPL